MNEQTTQQGLPQVQYFDYKDYQTLKRYVNPHGRIVGRTYTKLPSGAQRQLARAVKNARFMGFLPYVIN
jgi:small subunit ribosomal protein S18